MRPELIVFDMAGTTVYDGDAVHTCLGAAVLGGGVEVTRDEINAVMGLPKPLAIRQLLQQKTTDKTAIETGIVDRIYADFLARMLAYYRADPAVREIEGATKTFRALRTAGVRIALDTGFSRPIVDVVLARLGWLREGLLDATISSDEVANGRPHPDMIFRAMALTGVSDARRVAKVGDTPSDLQEGRAAGCGWIIGVTEGSHTREQLEPYPHTHLLGTVAELPACLLAGEPTS